jgi:putative transposase
MARQPRVAPGGLIYHVLNRSAGNVEFLRREKDFAAFEKLLIEAHQRHPIKLLSYCLMGTHWHFVVFPENDGDLTAFFRWLTHTHAMRWRVAHQTVGFGHLYQGRFKSFIVEEDKHLLNLCRYVERNALAAGLVDRAQDWRWSSLWAREEGPPELRAILSEWPVNRPRNWIERVNRPLAEKELARIQTCISRGQPLGGAAWVEQTVNRLHLQHTIGKEGRPKQLPGSARVSKHKA